MKHSPSPTPAGGAAPSASRRNFLRGIPVITAAAATVPTPAIVAPIEFSMRRSDYEALGGHVDQIRSLREVLERGAWHNDGAPQALVWQAQPAANPWPLGNRPLLG